MTIRRTAMAGMGIGIVAIMLVALSLRASQAPRRWMALDGRDWTQFSPREKQAFVAGFLAGAGGAAAGTADTAVLRRTVDSLSRGGALRYPFGHMVYATQLDEFYWWENHVPIPLYVALSSINQGLRQQQHDP
jgi:drug/metabolite transporter (DMT)-like permease